MKITDYITETPVHDHLDDFFQDGSVKREVNLQRLMTDLIQEPPMHQEYTVYIPSKGRPTTGSTYKLCQEAGIPYNVVVEPQDYPEYKKIIPAKNLVMLAENDKGIQYARSFIKQYSQAQGETHHWQMDDDMKYFTIRKNNKNVRIDIMSAISIVEYVSKLFKNVGISGITSNAFAFSKPHKVQPNRLAYGVVLVNNSIGAGWRDNTVEDWDYTLNLLEEGHCTLAFNHVNFVTPASGSNAGGNQMTDWETVEKRKEFYEGFAKLWPDYFECRPIKNDKTQKGYKLHHKSRFFQNYKQELELSDFLNN